MVSAVGFGTCQLRLVPRRQAMETLKRGFELGVNLVHTSPDYEGADVLVARAAKEAGGNVMALSQGYGDMPHFEYLYERAHRLFEKDPLDMFGIACIDDREYLGEDVWGPNGMVRFLLKKKEEGRLTGIYCTTHGDPSYVTRLIRSGHFDAIMISTNALGFHLLSYHPEAPKKFEDIAQNRERILPLAEKHGVSLLIMKPLAGGLLCKSRAFPPHHWFASDSEPLSASDLLRHILMQPGVCSVVPGTASVAEAEENALAGHSYDPLEADCLTAIAHTVREIGSSLCSRCGFCDSLCSKSLPISWLFRDAYISNYPSETFETLDRLQYFYLHPWETAACVSCDTVTCRCPKGIDIPKELINIHGQMLRLREEGLLPATPIEDQNHHGKGPFTARVIRHQVPHDLFSGQKGICRFCLENTGRDVWRAPADGDTADGVMMGVFSGRRLIRNIPLRQDVDPGDRGHFAFVIRAPGRVGGHPLIFTLLPDTRKASLKDGAQVLCWTLRVIPDNTSVPAPGTGPAYARLRRFIAEKFHRTPKPNGQR